MSSVPPADRHAAFVISIKHFLAGNSETDQTSAHVVRILLQAIGQVANEGGAEDCEQFRTTVTDAIDSLDGGAPAEELLVRAGSVQTALAGHIRRNEKRHRLQTTELQNMVKMLTSTVSIVSAASDSNVGRLAEIEKQIAGASELEDVRLIKDRLSECLNDIRRESKRQLEETGDIIDQLRRGVAQAGQSLLGENAPRDSITGLPLRKEAEAALAQCVSGESAYVIVLVLDRVALLNARFGREVGNDILAAFARMVRDRLSAADRLFRWDGPVLVGLLNRPSLLQTRGEICRVMDTKMEHTVHTPSRTILLPISARWTLFPIMTAPRLMYQKIDTFSATQSAHD